MYYNIDSLVSSGVLNFREFAVGLSMSLKGSFEDKLYWVFSLYDVDGDGHISPYEIKQIIEVKMIYRDN